MGRRGPRKTPTNIVELRGNPGKRALNHHEPEPNGRTTCPNWLSGYARTEWRRLSPSLEMLGLLTVADRAAMAGYCESYARWRQAEEIIRHQLELAKRILSECGIVAGMATREKLAAMAAYHFQFSKTGHEAGDGSDVTESDGGTEQDAKGAGADGTMCCVSDVTAASAGAGIELLYTMSDVTAAEAIVLNGGLVTVTDKGNVIQHPMVGIANQAKKDMLKFAGEMGLSPAARSRISIDRTPKQGDFLSDLDAATPGSKMA